MMTLLREASWSDVWFAYAVFNHQDTDQDLGIVARDFLSCMGHMNCPVPEYIDHEWLIREYHKRL